MNYFTVLFILLFGFVFNMNAQVDERTKFQMFCTAYDGISTSPYFVVINVKNLNTGEVKEICTEGPFVQGAENIKTGSSIPLLDCEDHKNMYFEYAKSKALRNIGFDLYDKEELEQFEKSINVDSLVHLIEKGNLEHRKFQTDKEQRMFAHLMINHGVMVRRSGMVGSVCIFEYFREG